MGVSRGPKAGYEKPAGGRRHGTELGQALDSEAAQWRRNDSRTKATGEGGRGGKEYVIFACSPLPFWLKFKCFCNFKHRPHPGDWERASSWVTRPLLAAPWHSSGSPSSQDETVLQSSFHRCARMKIKARPHHMHWHIRADMTSSSFITLTLSLAF